MPCMCGGCDQCLRDQGYDPDLPELGPNDHHCPACDAEKGVYDPDDDMWRQCGICKGQGVLTEKELNAYHDYRDIAASSSIVSTRVLLDGED